MDQRQYVLTLQPLSDSVPETVRLRRALKTLLRSFGLRTVMVQEQRIAKPDRVRKPRPIPPRAVAPTLFPC